MNDSETRAQSIPSLDDARISGAINKILEHPELIGMIGSMLTTPKPSDDISTDTPEENTAAVEAKPTATGGADMLTSLAPILSKLQSSKGALPHKDDKRECLLCALKPYLSKERCEAIDQMLKISRISDIFKNMS